LIYSGQLFSYTFTKSFVKFGPFPKGAFVAGRARKKVKKTSFARCYQKTVFSILLTIAIVSISVIVILVFN
jgi:hypothetical protein